MTLVKLQLLAVMVLMTLSGGFYTMSYFSDIEGTVANSFVATLLDQEVTGQPLDGLLCSTTDRASTVLYSGNLGPMTFAYGFAVENANGTLCNGLSARLITDDDGMLYDGPLLGLQATEIVLDGGGSDELHLEIRLTSGTTAVGTCTFDTRWLAEQFMGTVMPGFSDNEVITHTIQGSGTGIGEGCVPPGDTVYLHLSKAISGETLGYDLSDFSYRVTGNGIDVIVPHNQTVALPAGTYTIEELVPPDFIKPDWRIGWYGECESGSTFFTTVTIDEGNIDHGTLYCQADNQYRPDQRARAHDESRATSNRRVEEVRGAPVVTETTTETETEDTNEGDGVDGADGTGAGTAGQSVNNSAPGNSGGQSEQEEEPDEVEEQDSEPDPEPTESTETI